MTTQVLEVIHRDIDWISILKLMKLWFRILLKFFFSLVDIMVTPFFQVDNGPRDNFQWIPGSVDF